jgi:hypothetical protein
VVSNSKSSLPHVIAANFVFSTVVTSFMSDIWTQELSVGYQPLETTLITSNVSLLTCLATFPTLGVTAPRQTASQ